MTIVYSQRGEFILKINNIELDFDVEHYLSSKNIAYNMVGNNAMMCCPFHKEEHPSFGISVTKGVYRCFSGSCGVRGNLVEFIMKMETIGEYEAAERWLIVRYGRNVENDYSPIDLVFGDAKKQADIIYIGEEELRKYDFRHPYLGGRGIGDLWQARFRVGFDRERGAVTMPWYDRLGRCVGIKFRSVFGKFFWYYSPNDIGPNKITFFGLNHIYRRREKTVVIVESEIDAMYLWQNGFPAIALGTSSITKAQLQELKNTYVQKVIIATDNDEAGRKIAHELIAKLTWITDINMVDWSLFSKVKDVNELSSNNLKKLIESACLQLPMSILKQIC